MEEEGKNKEGGKKKKKTAWHVEVNARLFTLAEEASQVGSYSSTAEFIRAAVRRRIKELLPDAKL